MILYIAKEGDILGTSTRRTNKKVHDILKTNKINSTGEGINRIISEALFPSKGKSRLKNSIINSTCTTGFIKTLTTIITTSQKINANSNFNFDIYNFNELTQIEKVECIADKLCLDEDPLLKQTIMNILHNENSPIEYFKNAYIVIKDLLAEYYTEQFEKIMFEELASSTNDMDDEECKKKIKEQVSEALNESFSYNNYQLIIEAKENESFLKKQLRNIGTLILRGLKI